MWPTFTCSLYPNLQLSKVFQIIIGCSNGQVGEKALKQDKERAEKKQIVVATSERYNREAVT